MILNNLDNMYIGKTQVQKIMFNLIQIWPNIQNTIAEGVRRLSFLGQSDNQNSGESGSGSGNSGSGTGSGSGSGESDTGGESGSGSGSGNSGTNPSSGNNDSSTGQSGENNTPTIEISGSGSFIYTYRIYGNEQIINSITYKVGDKVENINKYIIPIILSDRAYNIILDSPLGVNDYIDYRTQKRYNQDGTIQLIQMPQFILIDGLNYIEVDTYVIPSKIEIVFNETYINNHNYTINPIEEDPLTIYGPNQIIFLADKIAPIVAYKFYGSDKGWIPERKIPYNPIPKLGVGQYWQSAKTIGNNFDEFINNVNFFAYKKFILIENPQATYTLWITYGLKKTSGDVILNFYDNENNFLSSSTYHFVNSPQYKTIIIPSNATKIRIAASINFWQVGLVTDVYNNEIVSGGIYTNNNFNTQNFDLYENNELTLYKQDYIYYYKAPSVFTCVNNGVLNHNGIAYSRGEMNVAFWQDNCIRFNGMVYNEYGGFQMRIGGNWTTGYANSILPIGKYKIGVTAFNIPNYDNYSIYCQLWSNQQWWHGVTLFKNKFYGETSFEITQQYPLNQLNITIENKNNYPIQFNETQIHVIILPQDSELSTKVEMKIIKNNEVMEQPVFAFPILKTIEGENNLFVSGASRVELHLCP